MGGLLGRDKLKILSAALTDSELAEAFNTYFSAKIINISNDLSTLEATVDELSFNNL